MTAILTLQPPQNPNHYTMPPKRHFPPQYEKFIPVMLGITLVAMIVLLVIIVGVMSGLIPYT